MHADRCAQEPGQLTNSSPQGSPSVAETVRWALRCMPPRLYHALSVCISMGVSRRRTGVWCQKRRTAGECEASDVSSDVYRCKGPKTGLEAKTRCRALTFGACCARVYKRRFSRPASRWRSCKTSTPSTDRRYIRYRRGRYVGCGRFHTIRGVPLPVRTALSVSPSRGRLLTARKPWILA